MRHITNAIALMLLIVIVGSAQGTASAHRARAFVTTSPTDSVTYQSTISHDGHVVDPTITLPLVQRWTVSLTHPSYPIIAQGLVIVTSYDATTGSSSHLSAFDSSMGTEVWSDDISGRYGWAAATYDNGFVFVVNFDGVLRAVNAADGTTLWVVQLPGQYAFSAAPNADSGVVYLAGSGIGGTLYAVDETNGDVLWTRSVENGDDSSPALSDNSVFVSYACSYSYGFARVSGAPIWQTSGSCVGGGGSTAPYSRGRVYVRNGESAGGGGLVLGAGFGREWGTFSSSTLPAFAHGMGLFLHSGSLLGKTLPDLTTAWSFDGPRDLSTPPLVVNGWVFVGSRSGRVYGRRATSGHGVWHADIGARISASPTTGLGAGGGLLVVPAADRLVAFGSA
ncbi:MAG: PQQ-binding-like beta-propeller repeat protein [Actinomycetota bacterium]